MRFLNTGKQYFLPNSDLGFKRSTRERGLPIFCHPDQLLEMISGPIINIFKG